MTPENAEYHRLMLLAGFREDYDRELDQAQLEEDPLSGMILELSFCQSDAKQTEAVLHRYTREHPIDHDAVFHRMHLFFRERYLSGAMTSREILDALHRLVWSAETVDHPYWYDLCAVEEYGDLAREGLISGEDYRVCFESFLLGDGHCIQCPWARRKASPLPGAETVTKLLAWGSVIGAAVCTVLFLAMPELPVFLYYVAGFCGVALFCGWQCRRILARQRSSSDFFCKKEHRM